MKTRYLELGSAIGAVGSAVNSAVAAICCIGPLALTLLGVNGMIFAAGLMPYRFYLLAGSLRRWPATKAEAWLFEANLLFSGNGSPAVFPLYRSL